MQKEKIIQDLLLSLGEDLSREGILGTPFRVVKSWEQIYGGYKMDIPSLFTVFEKGSYNQMILLSDIEVYSMCEHHMLPFFGKAHIAYIPSEKVLGISKLARLVDAFSRRLQIQERICEQVTEAIMKYLKPAGVGCVIQAQHMCMTMRGVNKQKSIMTSSSLKGNFLEDPSVKQEFFNLIKL